MKLDPRRAALWDAMGLGPVWRDRAAVQAEIEVEAAAQAAAAPVPAEPAGARSERALQPARSPAREAQPMPAPQVAEARKPWPAAAPALQRIQPAPIAAPGAPADVADPERARRIASLGWEELRADVAACRACGLCESRIQTVFAAGEPSARWVIVGEAPGADEDMRGEPFVGQAGKLLDAMLAALGLARGPEVAILNVLKCRPPANRNPEPAEVAACAPYLARQLELIAPDRVLVLGRFAAQSLLATGTSIAGLRGRLHSIEIGGRAVPVVVSYHPAYLLRNLADKARSWEDLLLAKRTAPPR